MGCSTDYSKPARFTSGCFAPVSRGYDHSTVEHEYDSGHRCCRARRSSGLLSDILRGIMQNDGFSCGLCMKRIRTRPMDMTIYRIHLTGADITNSLGTTVSRICLVESNDCSKE